MPPALPCPEALDQTMFGSLGSGVAQPLSPPPTELHMPRLIPGSPSGFPSLLLLGPRVEGPSCRFPYTKYGIWSSTVTWYIWATGSETLSHVRQRFVVIETPPS